MSRRLLTMLFFMLLLAGCSAQRALELALKDVVGQADQRQQDEQDSSLVPLAMYERFLTQFQGRLENEWGEREVAMPTRYNYVKYTQNYLSRAMVDFDKGAVIVETLDAENPLESLRQALVTTLLTPDDPNAVDLYSTRQVKLNGQPFLYGLVLDHNNRPVDGKPQAEKFAKYLISKRPKTRVVRTAKGRKVLYSLSIVMVNNHINIRARRYSPYVERYARKFGVSKSLIYAVMKTESNFNAFAVSTASAYGLMQLVPSSGGRDAYRFVKGKDVVPSREYLFEPDNNIELGAAYLSLLDHEYLKEIKDPVSREYCMISAYNGGVGTLLRTFSRDKDKAMRIINSLNPAEVHDRLRTKHPFKETRDYLARVVTAKKEFVRL